MSNLKQKLEVGREVRVVLPIDTAAYREGRALRFYLDNWGSVYLPRTYFTQTLIVDHISSDDRYVKVRAKKSGRLLSYPIPKRIIQPVRRVKIELYKQVPSGT